MQSGALGMNEALEEAVNLTLEAINDWIVNHGLPLAYQKTVAIILTRKWAFRSSILISGGHPVAIKRNMRHLGLHLYSHLTFKSHIKMVSSRAARSNGSLMSNLGRPSQFKRALLISVVGSRLLNAPPTWAEHTTNIDKFRNSLIRAQSVAALRVTQAYHTVLADAALLLACTPPKNLLAIERKRIRSKI